MRDIQVLTPTNETGLVGAHQLNRLLQVAVKPFRAADFSGSIVQSTEEKFYKGDKVCLSRVKMCIAHTTVCLFLSVCFCVCVCVCVCLSVSVRLSPWYFHCLLCSSLKVMQILNNYDKGVYNGEHGVVDSINHKMVLCMTHTIVTNDFFSCGYLSFSDVPTSDSTLDPPTT